MGRRPRPPSMRMTTRTSVRISCCGSEATFSLYQSTRRRRKAATSTIPIVFSLGTDPVRLGLVASLNRPSGNMTGVYFLQSELGAKRLGLLHEVLPKATVIGLLVNPNFAEAEFHAKQAQEAARPLGVQIHVVRASTVDQFDTAFSFLVQQKASGLFHANDAFFISERRPLIALARATDYLRSTHGVNLSWTAA